MLSVGMIIGGGVRLVRDRPGSVLAWGVVYSLGAFALGYVMMSFMAPMEALGERPNPGQALAAVGSFFGMVVLLQLAFLCLWAVLLAAAQRAVLRPEESGLAFIRFGGDELRMIGLALFLGFLFLIGYIIAATILGLVMVAIGVPSGAPGAVAPAAIVGVAIIFCLVMFLWVKVSLAFPLTLMRRRFVLGEAWSLSRGHFWTLLGGYIVLMLIVIGLAIVASFALQGSYWSQMMGGLTAPEAQRAARAQMEAQYTLGLPMLLNLGMGVVIGGLMVAFTGGAVATAARALATDTEGMAQTFS